MIPFPYLPYNNEDGFFVVCIKQVNKSSKYRYGYYRIENDILIGKNGQISIEEFMKETVRALKNRKIDLKQCVEKNTYGDSLFLYQKYSVNDEYLRENRIIKISKYKISFLDFFSRNVKYFLSQKDFVRLIPHLLFDNDRYVGITYP